MSEHGPQDSETRLGHYLSQPGGKRTAWFDDGQYEYPVTPKQRRRLVKKRNRNEAAEILLGGVDAPPTAT